MYSLFLRNREHRSKAAATPSSIKDDTSVSLSSWACLDTSVHGGTSPTSRHHSSDSAIRYNHTGNIGLILKAPPSRGDDASISMSISSWAGIDTDNHQAMPRMYFSDRAINYSHANSDRSTCTNTMAKTVQASKANIHSRESSWGQVDPEFMANLAEHRDKAAQDLIRRRQDEKTKATRRTGAAKSPGSYSNLPGGKSCDKKLHAPRKGRPPLGGQKMVSARA
jgi:hypothetical protein